MEQTKRSREFQRSPNKDQDKMTERERETDRMRDRENLKGRQITIEWREVVMRVDKSNRHNNEIS